MKPEETTNTAVWEPPLGRVARTRLAARLEQALELARRDEPQAAGTLHEILRELADRAGAWEMVAALDNQGGTESAAAAVSQLRRTALASAGGEPAKEFLLIPFGEVRVERPVAGQDFTFTRKHAESARRWFEQIGRKLAIDYEHQSFDRLNTRPDGLRPAAGWIGGLEIRVDGLWAVEVTWTGRARELLKSGEYRYYSPVIYWTDADRSDVAALGPVALTNDPAMHGVRPLAATRRPAEAVWQEAADEDVESETFEQESLAEAAQADLVAFPPEDEQEMEETPAAEPAAREELAAARTELALLKQQLLRQEADTFIERGMRLGKILDSTSMDWRADYLRDAAAAEERLSRAPALLPPGRIVPRDGQRAPALQDDFTAATERARAAEAYHRWGVEPADLAAYERAVLAGRVRGGAASR